MQYGKVKYKKKVQHGKMKHKKSGTQEKCNVEKV